MNELQHISERDFMRYRTDALKGPELTAFQEHLLWCLPCLERAEQYLRNEMQKSPTQARRASTGRAASGAA